MLRNLSTRDRGLEVTGIVQTDAEELKGKDGSNREVDGQRTSRKR